MLRPESIVLFWCHGPRFRGKGGVWLFWQLLCRSKGDGNHRYWRFQHRRVEGICSNGDNGMSNNIWATSTVLLVLKCTRDTAEPKKERGRPRRHPSEEKEKKEGEDIKNGKLGCLSFVSTGLWDAREKRVLYFTRFLKLSEARGITPSVSAHHHHS